MTRTSRTERKQRCRLTAPQDVYRLRRTGRTGSRMSAQSSAPRRRTRCPRIKSFWVFFVRIRKCFERQKAVKLQNNFCENEGLGTRDKRGSRRNGADTQRGVCHIQGADLCTPKKEYFPPVSVFKSFDKKSGRRPPPIPNIEKTVP